ncbi:MAG: hypothetical protein M1450_05040 [Patescibacteria group bacterium]|nr:hypothetical protein [Patescibacteria group bacterium]
MGFKNLVIKIIAFYFIIVGLSQLLGALYFAGYTFPSVTFLSDATFTHSISNLFSFSTPPSVRLWFILVIGLFTGYQLLRKTKSGLYLTIALPVIGLIFTVTKTSSFPTILDYIQWVFSGLVSGNLFWTTSSIDVLISVFIPIYLFTQRKMFNGIVVLGLRNKLFNQQNSPQQPNPTPEASKKPQNIILIIPAVIILLIILGVIYLIMPGSKRLTFQKNSPANKAVNWKTYTTRDGNFQFEYPDNITISESLSTDSEPDHTIITNYGSATSAIFFEKYLNNNSYKTNISDIAFLPKEALINKSLDDFVQSEGFLNKANQEKQTITIAGVQGYRFKFDKFGTSSPTYIVKINNQFIELENHSNSNSEFDKTISSFKFIGKEDISNWKTYIHPKGYFSFKYPNKDNLEVKDSKINASDLGSVEVQYSVKSGSVLKDDINPFYLSLTASDNDRHYTNEDIKQNLLSSKPAQSSYATKIVDIKDYKNREIDGIYYILTGDQESEYIQQVTKDKLYVFSFNSEGSRTGGKTRLLIDQILSTFKFIGDFQKISVSSWQKYKDHYAEVSFDYPSGWSNAGCPGAGAVFGCADFYPLTSEKNMWANLIEFSANSSSIPASSRILVPDNFYIPSLAKNEKASVYKLEDGTLQIEFNHYGYKYIFSINKIYAQEHSIDMSSVEEIMKHMAKSVTFINELYSCKDPALSEISTFPDNFTLWNRHDSDGTDPINSVTPYSRVAQNAGEYGSMDTSRVFMINYIKSGNTFDNSSFINNVIAISGDNTSIMHINCVDTQDDGPGMPEVYSIGSDNPLSISVYGYKDNSSNLWGVSKWNVNLLKKTRNEVYIQLNNKWQKYIATGYFVSTSHVAYAGKPAIYLYPQKTSNINVVINPLGSLIKTDDLYNSSLHGWSVTAQPDGTINNKYQYLYYEALMSFNRPKTGFVVSYNDLFNFTNDYIKKLGLNNKESEEFINYWQKILKPSPFYFVSHLNLATINKFYPLSIFPKPDSLLRVEIYFEPLTEKIPAHAPIFETQVQRNGFTAVEWGAIYNK